MRALRYLFALALAFTVGYLSFAGGLTLLVRYEMMPLGYSLGEMRRGVTAATAGDVMNGLSAGYNYLIFVILPSSFFVVGFIATCLVRTRTMATVVVLSVFLLYVVFSWVTLSEVASACVSALLVVGSYYVSKSARNLVGRKIPGDTRYDSR